MTLELTLERLFDDDITVLEDGSPPDLICDACCKYSYTSYSYTNEPVMPG